MKRVGYCMLALAALGAAAPGTSPFTPLAYMLSTPAADAAQCAPATGAPASRVKPSSFAPHARSRWRVYGAPIQKPILGRRSREYQGKLTDRDSSR